MEPNLDASKPTGGFLRRFFRLAGAAEPSRAREATVIAFASGKGGTGKSFLTTNAAICLHRAGRRVAVVDCDFGLANAHLLFGVTPRYSVQHLLDGAVSVQQALTATPYGPGLVAGGSGVSSLAELDARHMQLLGRALHWLAGCHDVLLLDCPAGLSPQSLTTVLASQHAVVVTNPEIAALTDAYALIKCLARQPSRPQIHLIVNRVTQAGLGEATFERLADVSRRFAGCEIHYIGEVPEDAAVSQRRLGQPPLTVSHPQCATSQAIQTVLRNLECATGGLLPMAGETPGVEARMAAQLRRW
ncbi:MAG: P-loop NTPase [Planctomycetes bacterium]|nr:P-loop NTPase [Planctomycetota bacterium]MCB9883875.1 P-loop NTPase [Planctomycetota bacterium]